MDNSFFAYLQQLEIMAFFSGFPLLYAIVFFIANSFDKKPLVDGMVSFLPLSYGICGLLFLGLQARNLYPDFSLAHMKEAIQQPMLMIWGLLSIIFLLPLFRKWPLLSLLHSFVFFFIVIRDLYYHSIGDAYKEVISNDMKVYMDSFLLNLSVFLLVMILYRIGVRFKGSKPPTQVS